jgi:tRNA(fMet)-specific endonuclease VapC
MLDTNIVSALMRDPQGPVPRHIARVGEDAICLSIITAAELRFGAEKAGSAALRERVAAVLARVPVLPFEMPADAAYARIRARLQAQGRLIGPNDLLIAAHAAAVGATIVTANAGEFRRVPDLAVEDWTIPVDA